MHIWRIYGTPETITSDRNPQFIAEFFRKLAKLTEITLQPFTTEHAQTNDQTEIMNQFIQTKLRPFVNYFQNDWSALLLCLNFAYVIQPYESTSLSPSEVELGYLPRMLFDWQARTRTKAIFRDRLSHIQAQTFAKRRAKAVAFARAFLRQAQQKYEKQANRFRKPIDWQIGNKVYVRKGKWTTDRPYNGLDNPYLGPYKILGNLYPNIYEMDLPPSIKARRFLNANRLMKARDDAVPGQVFTPSNPVEINDEME
jgi:hypothetical protein